MSLFRWETSCTADLSYLDSIRFILICRRLNIPTRWSSDSYSHALSFALLSSRHIHPSSCHLDSLFTHLTTSTPYPVDPLSITQKSDSYICSGSLGMITPLPRCELRSVCSINHNKADYGDLYSPGPYMISK